MKLIKKIKSTIKSNNKNNVDSNQKIYYRVPGRTGNEKGECIPIIIAALATWLAAETGVYDDFFDDFNNFFDDIFSIFD